MSRSRKQGADRPDPAAEAFAAGADLVRRNPALAAVHADFVRAKGNADAPGQGLVRADSNGRVHIHPTRRAEPGEWAWALAHALLHLGFGHLPAAKEPREQPDRFDLAARCTVVNRFLATFPIGTAPDHLPESYPDGDEEQLAARWRKTDVPAAYERCGTADGEPDQLLVQWPRWDTALPDRQLAFAYALTRTVSAAMDVAGGRRDRLTGERVAQRPWDRALNWFVSSYPLLGGLAAGLTVVADAELARVHDIAVAAVDASAGVIYINPLKRFTDEEWRFILAHEMLHAALRHGGRRGARDHYLFNVAADYVINGWLVEMSVGAMPEGLLYDAELKGMSTEEVYDRIATGLRRGRRLATLRGKGTGDILGAPLPGRTADPVDLDAFYRRALVQGHQLHTDRQRGLLPAGLVQEIRALAHPPVPWDARLARWFDEFVPRPEPVRSYSRPARRQARPPTSRARAAPSRPRRSRAAPSASSWTPRARCPARCSPRHWARSPRTPRPATYRPPAWCSATPPPTTPVIWRRRRSPGGYGSEGAAARSCNPASTSFTVPRTSRRRPPSW